MTTIRENGGTYSDGASDGHIWNRDTGECSPLCPADGGHSRAIVTDEPFDLEAELRRLTGGTTIPESELRALDGDR